MFFHIVITLLGCYQVSLVSSVPRLLVNNTGSNATGTDVYPQPGAPLEVWCLTEQDEAKSRRWYNPSRTWLQPMTETTDEDVYVLNAPGKGHVKILKFRSYQPSQAGRYYCSISLKNVNSRQVVQPIHIGISMVKGVTVMVSGSATSPKIRVSWTAVDSPSSAAYTVYYSTSTQPPPGSGSSVQNITGTSLTLTTSHGIQTGTTYYIWVSAVAVTSGLEGPYSDGRDATTRPGLAPVPMISSVKPTPSEGTLRVTWTRPTVIDGSTITSYSIQYKRSNEMTYSSKTVNGGDTTSSDITGLDLSTQYSVRIASVNELGTGDYSGIVRATTYGYAPPPKLKASPRPQGKVRVHWTPPTPPPGSSLTGYSIQYRMGGSGSYMTASDPGVSATTTIVSNLQVGTQYQVRVAAKTELGVGPNSYGTTQVTAFNGPGQVPNLAVQPSELSNGQISLTVTWGEPQSDVDVKLYNGNYRILPSGTWTGHFIQPATRNRQHVYRNLMSGVNYEVRVRAVSAIGAGEYRTATTSLPITTIVQTTTSLYLQWTSSGGDTFTLYYWKNSTPSNVSTVTTTSLSHNITGLDSNTAYKVIVSARNVQGSANSSEVKGCTIPEASDLVTLNPLSSTSINVRWSPPPNSDRLPLTYYVNYTGMSRSASDSTLTLTGLHPYEEYTISVQAGNEGGLSVPVTGTARTYSDRPSSQPTMRFNIPGRRWCVLQWMIPEASGRNGVIPKYIIELEKTEDNKWNITHEVPVYNFSSPASISYNLINLTPHTTYKWRVAAATVNGTGPFAPTPNQFTTLEDIPGPVSRLTYNGISNMSVNISWSEPDEPNGDIVGYSVRYGEFEGNADSESLVESLHLTINGLMRYIPYKATVSARTSVGEGEPSSVVFFTLEGVPTTPLANVDVYTLGDGLVRVRWTPLSLVEARGFPLYIASYTSENGAVFRSVNTTNSSVIITGLNLNIGYTFTVQVATGSGNGPTTTKYLKGTLPSPSGDTTGVTVGAFIGGAMFGTVTVVLVVGIVSGVFKLSMRRKCYNRNTKQESQKDPTYEEVETSRTVHHDTNFIMMEKNVAYDSVDFKA